MNLSDEEQLRKWCLERAFEKRDKSQVWHLEVTNVADDYYRWIIHGESQGSRLMASILEEQEAQ